MELIETALDIFGEMQFKKGGPHSQTNDRFLKNIKTCQAVLQKRRTEGKTAIDNEAYQEMMKATGLEKRSSVYGLLVEMRKAFQNGFTSLEKYVEAGRPCAIHKAGRRLKPSEQTA